MIRAIIENIKKWFNNSLLFVHSFKLKEDCVECHPDIIKLRDILKG